YVYLDTHKCHNIVPERALLHLGLPRPHFGYEAMNKMLSLTARPSAVIMASSELTLGAIEAIQQQHINIPNDLALIAYHDPAWFKLWGNGITCVRLPIHDMAAAAATRLLSQIQPAGAEDSETDTPFVSQLVVRGSA